MKCVVLVCMLFLLAVSFASADDGRRRTAEEDNRAALARLNNAAQGSWSITRQGSCAQLTRNGNAVTNCAHRFIARGDGAIAGKSGAVLRVVVSVDGEVAASESNAAKFPSQIAQEHATAFMLRHLNGMEKGTWTVEVDSDMSACRQLVRDSVSVTNCAHQFALRSDGSVIAKSGAVKRVVVTPDGSVSPTETGVPKFPFQIVSEQEDTTLLLRLNGMGRGSWSWVASSSCRQLALDGTPVTNCAHSFALQSDGTVEARTGAATRVVVSNTGVVSPAETGESIFVSRRPARKFPWHPVKLDQHKVVRQLNSLNIGAWSVSNNGGKTCHQLALNGNAVTNCAHSFWMRADGAVMAKTGGASRRVISPKGEVSKTESGVAKFPFELVEARATAQVLNFLNGLNRGTWTIAATGSCNQLLVDGDAVTNCAHRFSVGDDSSIVAHVGGSSERIVVSPDGVVNAVETSEAKFPSAIQSAKAATTLLLHLDGLHRGDWSFLKSGACQQLALNNVAVTNCAHEFLLQSDGSVVATSGAARRLVVSIEGNIASSETGETKFPDREAF